MTPNVYEMFCEQRKIWLSMKKDPDFEVDGYKNFIFLSKTTGRNLYPVNIRKTLQRIVNMNDTASQYYATRHVQDMQKQEWISKPISICSDKVM